jgi:hypothetical protein
MQGAAFGSWSHGGEAPQLRRRFFARREIGARLIMDFLLDPEHVLAVDPHVVSWPAPVRRRRDAALDILLQHERAASRRRGWCSRTPPFNSLSKVRLTGVGFAQFRFDRAVPIPPRGKSIAARCRQAFERTTPTDGFLAGALKFAPRLRPRKLSAGRPAPKQEDLP